MADQTRGGITWTDETWNVIRGCRRVNDDCRNCYAESLAATRLATSPKYIGLAEMTPDGPRWTGKIQLDEWDLLKPLSWSKPKRVFTNAMSDLFFEELPIRQIDRIVAVMALAHKHIFQVLTKRPRLMARYLCDPETPGRVRTIMRGMREGSGLVWPIPNVHWGTSIGHAAVCPQAMTDLARCRPHAAVLWISAEPLTEAVEDRLPLVESCNLIDETFSVIVNWVVGGGESGRNARPTHIAVARNLRDDCLANDVPFHWKQNGEWLHASQLFDAAIPVERINLLEQDNELHRRLKGENYYRVGKHAAGRLLDGEQYDAFPEPK